jgi:hypothetical protein
MRLWFLGFCEGVAETGTGLSNEDGSEIPAYERGRALGLAIGDRCSTLRKFAQRRV